ncbi:MAG: ribosome biogenesis GTPase Der [Candidatus Eremiobacteraeota bacterium]|nr:ribosome biogenesis GTPase Der [Candidatus Eremiobacteraeota bacterium]
MREVHDVQAEAAALRPPTVAIVGRPNVGKSALFNRLIGRRLAIVEDTPGVTRDRIYALAEWRDRVFSVVDTAGLADEETQSADTALATQRQAQAAATSADAIVMVVDAASGLHPLDQDVAQIVRKTRRSAILVANKCESPKVADAVPGEFARLGFGTPICVSAIHGEGTGDLLDAIVAQLPPSVSVPQSEDELALALVGQPNVGKSSLLNALLGEERSIVSEAPGTTRDVVDEIFSYQDRRIRLIDTAGVRKKMHAHGAINYYAALRSLQAIARCDIAILLIDAMRGPLAQDRRLAGMILEERKGMLVVANKWDLAREQGEYSQAELIEAIHDQLPFARFVPVTFLSALTKRRLGSLMPLVMRVANNLERRVPTPRLNEIIRDATLAHPISGPGGKTLKIFYSAQPAVHPPLFVFVCNDPNLVRPPYERFIENTIRRNYDFEGVPLTFEFRRRSSAEASVA